MRQTLEGLDLGDHAEDIVAQLSALGIDLDKATSEEVSEVGVVLYGALTKKFRPLIDALPGLATIPAKELTVFMRTLLRIAAGVTSDPKFQVDLRTMQDARASNRMSAIKAYMGAGFTRNEAMEMLIADTAGLRSAIASSSRSASASSSKRS